MSDRYLHRWRQAWVAWAVATLCLAAVLWSASAVLLLLVTAVVLTMLITGLVRSESSVDHALSVREVLADGGRWAVVAVAVVVVSQLQAGLAVLVLIAIALSSPQALRLFLGMGRGASETSGRVDLASALHALDMERAREVVHRLDLDGLCWAWTHSADLLAEVPQPPARAAVVALREVYLDEMERRDPAGFAAWLEAGVEAAASPARFLAAPRDDGQGRDLAA